MAHDTHLAQPEEAVGLAIDSYIAALSDDQVAALLTRTRAPKLERYPGKRQSRRASGNDR
jgi:hypothetical protein